jgi:Zn ribbon nucleic-acid-binding protein
MAKRATKAARNPGPPFVCGEALCPRCAATYKTPVKFPGHAAPPPVACVKCGTHTRTRVR